MRPRLGLAITTALALTGCPDPDYEVITTGSGSDPSETSAAPSTTGDDTTTGTTTSEPSPTTSTGTTEPGYDGVIAPTIRTFRPRAGEEVDVAQDPLPTLASVAIETDNQSYPAVYDGSTRLEFAGVPEDMYFLRQQAEENPLWPGEPGQLFGLYTAARVLKTYAGIFSGRPDVAVTDDPTTRIELSGSGLSPLGPEDQFEIYSYDADALLLQFPIYDPPGQDGSPPLGGTEIDGWSIAWRPDSSRVGWPLVAAGDDLHVGHLVAGRLVESPVGAELQDAWSYAQVYRLGETAEMSLASMTAGATTPATGDFVAVTPTTISVDLRAAEFMAELQQYDSPQKSVGCFVAAVLEPGTEHPVFGMTPNLGGINGYGQMVPVDPACPPDTCDPNACDACDAEFALPGDRVLELEYANPYSGGTETLVVQCSRYVYVPDPNGVDYDYLAADLIVSGRLAELAAGPIVPKMGLVRELKVNGTAVAPTETLNGVGTTPEITFTAPKFGAPDYYTVTVRRLDDLDGLDGPVLRHSVGSLRSEFTSITIPEGYLEPGGHYYIQVAAERGRGLTDAHFKSHDSYVSRAMTGIISP